MGGRSYGDAISKQVNEQMSTNLLYRSRVSIRKTGFENIVNWQIYVAMLRMKHRLPGVYPRVEFVSRRSKRDWAGAERYADRALGLIGVGAFLNQGANK